MNKFNTKTGFCKIVIATVLTSISFTANANRPALENKATGMTQRAVQEKAQIKHRNTEATQQAIQKKHPASSVDRIMQQPAANTPYQTTGDVLVLPPKEMQAGETIIIKKLNVPRRGVTMDSVRRELGAPIAASASVGQPPITRWTYKDRIVYFEYSKVLHVVAR